MRSALAWAVREDPFPWGRGVYLRVCAHHTLFCLSGYWESWPCLSFVLCGIRSGSGLCAGQEVWGGGHTDPQSQRELEVALEKFEGWIAFAQPGRPPGGPCLPLQHPLPGDNRQPQEVQHQPRRVHTGTAGAGGRALSFPLPFSSPQGYSVALLLCQWPPGLILYITSHSLHCLGDTRI